MSDEIRQAIETRWDGHQAYCDHEPRCAILRQRDSDQTGPVSFTTQGDYDHDPAVLWGLT